MKKNFLALLTLTAAQLASADTLKFEWNASPSPETVFYRLYESTDRGTSFSSVGTTPTLTFEYTKTAATRSYYYVVAVTADGVESVPSNVVVLTEKINLETQAGFTILTWVGGFAELQESENLIDWVSLGMFNGNFMTPTDQTAAFYRLR